jgi:hypothetical protein
MGRLIHEMEDEKSNLKIRGEFPNGYGWSEVQWGRPDTFFDVENLIEKPAAKI